MKLRTQLIAGFLALSVLPLSAIVIYGYVRSEHSFRRAVQQETRELATRMDEKMGLIRSEVNRRVERVGALPLRTLLDAANPSTPPHKGSAAELAAQLGDSAKYVDSFELIPDLPETPDTPALATGSAVPAPPAVEAAPAPPAAGPTPPVERVAPTPRTERRVVVINVPDLTFAPPAAAPFPAFDPASAAPRVVVGSHPVAVTEVAPPAVDQNEIRRHMEEAHKAAAEAMKTARDQIEAAQLAEMQRQSGTAPTAEQLQKIKATEERMVHLFGEDPETAVVMDGAKVGRLRAKIKAQEIIHTVLLTTADKGDIAFALDSEGKVYAAHGPDRETIESSGLAQLAADGSKPSEQWVVATSKDSETGLTFVIARPIRESLRQMKQAAAGNLAWGLGLVGLALLGIVPLANHLTRDIEKVTAGAEKIAHGELDTEVSVRSRNELGQLAGAFNRMARDLKVNQERLLDEERMRREREIEQRLLAAEYERKSAELEDARRFQLSLLPRSLPQHPKLEIAVLVRTATEVGGDYYDYHLGDDGELTVVVGDATGHGAKAGTMVTVVKSIFATFSSRDALGAFLSETNQTIRRMGLERMAMALSLARFREGGVEIAAAGMPPALVYRAAEKRVEEVIIEAPPIGTLAYEYPCRFVTLAAGDVVLMMTDGFPELMDEAGEPLGYVATTRAFEESATKTPDEILAALAAAVDEWTGGEAPDDDITFVAVRVREGIAGA